MGGKYFSHDLAFATPELEQRFQAIINVDEEMGGILFFKRDKVADIHWKTHQSLFGCNYLSMITDWVVVPNVSNRRRSEYKVSDLSQMMGMAEQTAESRGCYWLHWHSHPRDSHPEPSQADWAFWSNYNNGYAKMGAIACVGRPWLYTPGYDAPLAVVCHSIQNGEQYCDRFLHWDYIKRQLKKAADRKAARLAKAVR